MATVADPYASGGSGGVKPSTGADAAPVEPVPGGSNASRHALGVESPVANPRGGANGGGDEAEPPGRVTQFLNNGAASTWGYALIFVIAAVLALLFRYVGAFTRALRTRDAFNVCDASSLVCVGNQAVYRFSFSLVVFFLVMLVIVLVTPSAHRGAWFWKFLFWAGLTVAWFFIPGQAFVVYREIARVVSFFYLILQILIIVNMAYTLHERLVAQMDESSQDHDESGLSPGKARAVYVVLFAALFAVSITGIALLYVYYGKCPLHKGLISMTLILSVFCWAIGFLAGKGLLVPSVLVAYNVLITYQALQSNPDPVCNPQVSESVPIWQLVLLIVFNLFSVCWSATRAAQNTPSVLAGPPDAATAAAKAQAQVQAQQAAASGQQSQAAALSKEAEPSWWSFHLVMVLASFYLAMMLTGWGSETTSKINNTDASKESLWIKIASVISIFVLYIWTLIAPKVCANRDFS
jgi:hypothetical protein